MTRYALASGSCFDPLLALEFADGDQRYPLSDLIGTSRRLVDETGVATDAYSLDAFGQYREGWQNPTPNPYRYGAAWGYITDTPGSGLLQLGHRFYWPELGRFLQQDPAREGNNWYAYVGNGPLVGVDPEGLSPFSDWYMGGMGGASDWLDQVLLGGATQGFGGTAGRWDSGCASFGQLAAAAGNWGGRVGLVAWTGDRRLPRSTEPPP